MPRRIIGRILLVCAVLLAQQTALAHDLWHASAAQAGASAPKSPDGKKLCDLHDLLGTVLGAMSGVPPQAELLAPCDVGFTGETPASIEQHRFAAHSRGPPARS